MRWPRDHPVRTDPRLAEWQADADAVCPDGHAVELLRYVPGRRATTLVDTPDGPAVLKVFASPRARGNHRRLRALRPVTGSLVPCPLAVGPAGHAGLLEYVPGRPLSMLSGPDFVACSEELGRLLAHLQASGVRLDREWTALREIDALSHRLSPVGMSWSPPPPDALVPAHRDLHPDQAVVGASAVRLIDLDEAAMAPAGLDVGNFLAHLDRDVARGERSGEEAEAAGRAFLRGHGGNPRDLAWWRRIARARVAHLEEVRHGRPDWAENLRAVVD
jgi:Ser/Thr protein kinase RdoA (MazF antagonist)